VPDYSATNPKTLAEWFPKKERALATGIVGKFMTDPIWWVYLF
jgi:hypothetical protein